MVGMGHINKRGRVENMRSLQRRKQDVWFTTATKSDSHIEKTTTYSNPIKKRCSVSSTSGAPHELPVGVVTEYSRYLIIYDMDFQPEEGTLLFVDKIPELTATGKLRVDINGNPYTTPDYVIAKNARTLKGTVARYGIKKIAGDE